MSYISDYIHYNSGGETPEEYLYWSGLSLLGAVIGKKIWVEHGDMFRFSPNIYVCLVGEPGSGKNTAMGTNIDVMVENFPDLLISSSIQSREDVAWQMSDDDSIQYWQDERGECGLAGRVYDYRPFYILNDEFASFLSVDKIRMVEFLTDVFDSKRFSTGYKKDRVKKDANGEERKQWFDNPYVSLLVGAVPHWFMSSLKLDLFEGGLGSRLLIVNAKRTKIVPRPFRPVAAAEARTRFVNHLKRVRDKRFYGKVALCKEAQKWWDDWYRQCKKNVPDDPILKQFNAREPVQLLKVALLLHLAQDEFDSTMPPEPLMAASTLIEGVKKEVIRLTAGVGRNESAGVALMILDAIRLRGGLMKEVEIKSQFYRAMPGYNPSRALQELLAHMQETKQIMTLAPKDSSGAIVGPNMVFVPERYEEFRRNGNKL